MANQSRNHDDIHPTHSCLQRFYSHGTSRCSHGRFLASQSISHGQRPSLVLSITRKFLKWETNVLGHCLPSRAARQVVPCTNARHDGSQLAAHSLMHHLHSTRGIESRVINPLTRGCANPDFKKREYLSFQRLNGTYHAHSWRTSQMPQIGHTLREIEISKLLILHHNTGQSP